MIGCIITCTFVTILLMVSTAQSSCLCAFRLPELQVFYDAMSGPQWKSRWDFSDPSAPCMFSGVYCDSSDVTLIILAQQGLSGQLPAAIANLTKLTLFNVSFNSVTGTLPPDYAAWASISEFLVDSNNITGTLPPQYSAWGRMSRFYSGRNNISGTLPVSYSNWSIIREFDVQYNRLSGTLPTEFANWMIISSFILNNNLISSTLPPQYSQWGAAIYFFFLQDCDIYGSLPPSYSNWTSVSTFSLKNSRISGTLPPQYGGWIGIRLFVISYSSLSGTIPSTYNHWPGVTTIDLSNNVMTGIIPNNIWGSMTSLNAVALWNNSLSGTIPPQLLQVPHLAYLSLGFNQLTGTIPPATSSLRFLIVQNNSKLSGSIPASILFYSAFLLSVASICGTSIPCPNSTAPLYCFTHEMMYELYEQQVISAVIPYKAACSKSQPHEVLRSSTTATREEVAPDTNWTRAITLSSASLASSGVFTTIAVAQGFLVSGTSALSGGTHGMQAALMVRRKRALCQLSATRTIADSSGFPDLNQFTTDNDPSLLCCDAITSPTQFESIASLSPLIGALLGNTALVLILCLIKYSLPFAVRRFPGSNKKRGMIANGIVIALHTMAGEPTGPVSALWSPYMTLLAPTVATAFGAALLPGASAGLKVTGALGLCLCAGPWVVCAITLCWRSRRSSFPFQAAAVRGQRSKSWWKRLKEPSTNLIVAPSAEAYARQLLKDYGPVFEGYTASRYWYFNVALCLGFANGFMMGAGYNEAVRSPCSVWVEWCLVVLGLLEVLLGVVILRPFSVPLDALGLLVTVGLTTLSQLIPLLDASDGASDAADAIGLAASITQLALLLCSIVTLVSSGTPWRNVQFKKRVGQALHQEENGWQQKVPATRKKSAVATVTSPDIVQMSSVEGSNCSNRNLVKLVNLICSQWRPTDK